MSHADDLGQQHGLGMGPVAALAAAADGRPGVLVLDQVDAVSTVSGRLPQSFDVVAAMVRQVKTFPNLRVILACRQYDLDNDTRISGLRHHQKADVLTVASLTDSEIDQVVDDYGVLPGQLRGGQRELLRLPYHLGLWVSVAQSSPGFLPGDAHELFRAYWEQKARSVYDRQPETGFAEVVGAVANLISEERQLSIPEDRLDKGGLFL